MKNKLALTAAVLLAGLVSAPAFAATMASNSMMMSTTKPMTMTMKPGETMMVMPDGHGMMMMAPAKPDAAMKANMDAMMQAAKPMDQCMVMMMGKDGKMYMMSDMKMPDGKMMCDEMSMMKK